MKKIKLSPKVGSKSLGKILLEPTKIYVKEIKQLSKSIDIKSMAHITGGGLLGNLERIVCDNYNFELDRNKLFFYHKKLFKLLMAKASLSNEEMLRTFNCGYGMVLVIRENELRKYREKFLKKLEKSEFLQQDTIFSEKIIFIKSLRSFSKDLKVFCPGIRGLDDKIHDQKRVMGYSEFCNISKNDDKAFAVIGRPIYESGDAGQNIKKIIQSAS